MHHGCALHINNSASSASSCLPSCFTPLVIISLPLMVLYFVTGSFTGTKHGGHGYEYIAYNPTLGGWAVHFHTMWSRNYMHKCGLTQGQYHVFQAVVQTQTCLCFQNQNTGTMHPGCALHIKRIFKWWVVFLLHIISDNLSSTNGAKSILCNRKLHWYNVLINAYNSRLGGWVFHCHTTWSRYRMY